MFEKIYKFLKNINEHVYEYIIIINAVLLIIAILNKYNTNILFIKRIVNIISVIIFGVISLIQYKKMTKELRWHLILKFIILLLFNILPIS